MPSDVQTESVLRSVEAPRPERHGEEVSDALLLDRFVEQWDQAAFRDLMGRHGPMVLGVSRRILRDPHAAEDAFQVTFLLLARKAGSVRKRASIGPWLYGVARRVALEARGDAARGVPVRSDPEAPPVNIHEGLERDELHAALHEELGRLPQKYRTPLVLCYIEGITQEGAALQLGWPIGTVRVRIARGRDLLRGRLIRRGLTPAAVLLALTLLPETVVAAPARLIDVTMRAAARAAVGEQVPGGEVPARVVRLERKVRKAMHLTRLKWATAFTLATVASVAGVGVVVPRALAAYDDAAKVKAELKKFQGTWVPISAEVGGVKEEMKGETPQLKFDGETFTLSHNGHVEEQGAIKLDPSRDPMEIDLKFQEGKNKGDTEPAIYAWDGANLKLCREKERHERPTGFTTKPNDHRFLLIFKRAAP